MGRWTREDEAAEVRTGLRRAVTGGREAAEDRPGSARTINPDTGKIARGRVRGYGRIGRRRGRRGVRVRRGRWRVLRGRRRLRGGRGGRVLLRGRGGGRRTRRLRRGRGRGRVRLLPGGDGVGLLRRLRLELQQAAEGIPGRRVAAAQGEGDAVGRRRAALGPAGPAGLGVRPAGVGAVRDRARRG